MFNEFFLKKMYMLFCFAVIIFISSCSNSDSDKNSAAKTTPADSATSAITDTLAASAPDNAKSLSGNLNILCIDSATFVTLQKRMVFRFYIEGADKLTLHGWSSNDNTFTDPPDVKLNVGLASPYRFEPGTYLGNIILRKFDSIGDNQLKAIKTLLKRHHGKNVLFVPLNPAQNNGNIFYDIVISTEAECGRFSFQEISDVLQKAASDTAFIPKAIIPTNIRANPSPPKRATSEL